MIVTIIIAATFDNGDFDYLSIPLTFAPGSGDGALMCFPVEVVSDNKAEGEEEFSITITMVTAGASLSLGNNVTTVILTDDDGTLHFIKLCSPCIIMPPPFCNSRIICNAHLSSCC